MSLKTNFPKGMCFALFTCRGCGFVGTLNFRDSNCPVCKNVGDVDKLTLTELGLFVEPAPHMEHKK